VLDEVRALEPKRPDLLEWRIDFFRGIGDAAAVIDTAQAIRAASNGIPVLLTRRAPVEGGQPAPIDEAAVVALYGAVCRARCVELIDYELSNDAARFGAVRACSAENGIGLVASFHDFSATPAAAVLERKFEAAARAGADVAKVAVMPRARADVLTLLDAADRAQRGSAIPLIAISMGRLGVLSRIVSWMYGSAATFAAGVRESAPGQTAIEPLREAIAALRAATAA
jgi:3-dehydroquinate dehydratase-1